MKNKKIILPVILLLIVLILSTSFALWQIAYTQTGTNVVTTDCFKVTFTDEEPISIEDAIPITDEEGKKLTPYKFSLTNMCDSYALYDINLETLDTSTLIDLDYIKVLLNEKNQEQTPKLLTENTQVEHTLENASSSYKIGTGYLDYKESKSFELRLWMDEETETDEKYMNKTFENKVTITTSFTKETPLDTRNMMMERYDTENKDNYAFMSDTTKIVFRNKKTNPTDAEVVDISYNQDNSVVAYNDSSTESKITYIEANGKIKFPVNSSKIFYDYNTLTNIDGMEFVDTRQVTNMSSMFNRCFKLTDLDLSNFNTSNVTDMNNMFTNMSLTCLNLSNFDTSKVITMKWMFGLCRNLTDLNLNSFNTNSVIDMSYMFFSCSSITDLDLSNFDTSQVRDMSYMFGNCTRGLTSLDLSNFNTSNVVNMTYMFDECNSLVTLDISNFDTSQVTNMEHMFYRCHHLKTTITIRNTATISYGSMFSWAASQDGSQIIVNYTSEASDLVDQMIAESSARYNTVKGIQVD